jgi:hypothetical protein
VSPDKNRDAEKDSDPAPRAEAVRSPSSPASQSGQSPSHVKKGMGPTAVRGDQAPPGTTRDDKSAQGKAKEAAVNESVGNKSYRDLPRGYKASPQVGLQGLKRRAAVALDPIDPGKNVLVYSALEDEVTGATVAVEQEPLSTSEVESARQKLD